MEKFDIVIEPNKAEQNYWKDIWHYKELFYILAWRDVKVRYKQAVLGVAWSVIRPLLTMIVFTVVFSKVANMSSEGNAPYAILVFAGLLPWQFFSNALSESSSSLVSNANLISKVYFPRVIIPASTVVTTLIDFAISFGLMVCIMAFYQYIPSWKIIFMPFFILLCSVLALGSGIYLAALNVKYRDFRYIIPFITQFGLFISPVGFSANKIPEEWQWVYALNPMVGVIDGFRWCIIDGAKLSSTSVVISVVMCIILMAIGIRYFRKVEKSFADVI